MLLSLVLIVLGSVCVDAYQSIRLFILPSRSIVDLEGELRQELASSGLTAIEFLDDGEIL